MCRDHVIHRRLHAAAGEGNVHVIGFLLAQKADVNASDHRGCTPLDEAVRLATTLEHARRVGSLGNRRGRLRQRLHLGSDQDSATRYEVASEPHNKGMKLTSFEHNGRSQLVPDVSSPLKKVEFLDARTSGPQIL